MGCQSSTVLKREQTIAMGLSDTALDRRAKKVVANMMQVELDNYQAMMRDEKFLKRCADARAKAAEGDPSAELKLAAEQGEHINKQLGKVLEKLWDIYDEDANGDLDIEETDKLLKIYTQMKIEMTKQNLFLGMTISLQAQIPEGDKLMKKIFDQSLKAIEDRCHEEVEKWYERNILKKETFDRIRALVDKNDDGSVDKKEFLDGFWKAFVKVVDSNKLNSELGRAIRPVLLREIARREKMVKFSSKELQ